MKAVCLALALALGGAATAAETTFELAVRDYQAGRWSAAYGHFMVLANSGNADAARIALFMYRHGKLLYGADWAATDEDIELWSRMTGTRPPNEPDRVVSTAASKGPAWKPRMVPFIRRGDK